MHEVKRREEKTPNDLRSHWFIIIIISISGFNKYKKERIGLMIYYPTCYQASLKEPGL